jgi:hypothetical protein
MASPARLVIHALGGLHCIGIKIFLPVVYVQQTKCLTCDCIPTSNRVTKGSWDMKSFGAISGAVVALAVLISPAKAQQPEALTLGLAPEPSATAQCNPRACCNSGFGRVCPFTIPGMFLLSEEDAQKIKQLIEQSHNRNVGVINNQNSPPK